MSEQQKIENALTPDEWANHDTELVRRDGMWVYVPDGMGVVVGRDDTGLMLDDEIIPAVIALANAALPDSDPRKITRERVAALRVAVDRADALANEWGDDGEHAAQYAFLAALESYLPPEGA